MKILSLFFCNLFCMNTLFSAPVLENSWSVGNGGDLAACSFSDQTSEISIFSYDYMHSLFEHNLPPLRFNNLKQLSSTQKDIAFDKISLIDLGLLSQNPNKIELNVLSLLRKRNLNLYKSLNLFLNEKMRKGNTYTWQVNNELPEIHDEENTSLNEYHCAPIQLAIRTQNQDKINFQYSELYMLYVQMWPLQESFFFIHEWLRNYLKSAKDIRKANWFLHSQQAELMSNDAFHQYLSSLGIDVSQ